MATLQGKAVKNTYRQVLQIGANNVGVSGSLQPVQDGGGVNTSLSLSTTAATITGTLTINGDLIITGGGIQIQDLIDDTVASLIQNGTGITWAYNDTLRTLTPTITIATADGGVQGDFVQYNTGAGEANAVAKMYWNNTDGTVDLGLIGGNVVLPIGQKQVARVLNNSGSILNKSAYQVVKVSTAQGQRLAVTLAQANNDANSTDTLGLVAENIANNQDGFITTSGVINGIDTTGDLQLEDWNDGDVLYLSPTTPGAITKVKPVAPQHTIIVGFVVYAHKTQGKIYVKVDNGYELDELHNVRITNVANDNILQYNSSLAVWENVAGTTTNIAEGTNLYYTQGRFDSAFAAKSTTNLAEGTNLYFTTARGDANFATNFATKDTDDLPEGSTNLYYTNTRTRNALSVTAGTGIAYNSTTGNFNLGSIPNASLTNSSVTINGLSLALGASITLTTSNIAEGTNLYWTDARFDSRFGTKTTTNLAEGTNLYYTQARFNTDFDAKTTTDLDEGTNLYYTDARSRAAFSENAVGLDYSSGSGILSLTAGYAIPTTVKLGQYDTAYNRSIVSAAVTGTSTKTLSLTQQDANVVTATWTDQGITTINGTANQIAASTVGNTTTVGFTNDVTFPNNVVVSGNLTINGTATYVNTQSISSKDPLFEVANDNNTTDAVDIGYYGRYFDSAQTRVEFTGLFRDASDAGKFKFFTGLVDEPTNVVDTTGTGYTVGTLVANVEGNLAGTANAANVLSTARTISATGDAAWSVSFDGSANATAALTLANTGVTATTYGTTTAVPTIAVDSKGRITSASNTNIAFPVTTVNGASGTVVLTTSNITEGSNQYFTSARAQASITGGASSVVTADLTASRALVSDGSGKIAASSSTTATEIGYVAGVTSAIQTQLNSKLNLSGGTLTGGLSGTTLGLSGALSGTSATFTGANSTDVVTIAAATAKLRFQPYSSSGDSQILAEPTAGGSYNPLTLVGSTIKLFAFTGSNEIQLWTNNVQRLTIASTGNATFSNSVITNGNFAAFNGGSIEVYNTGTTNFFELKSTGGNFALRTNVGATPVNALTIASTGAATFSSSVTAASGLYNGYTSGLPPTSGSAARGGLRLNNASNIALDFGTVAAGQAWLQVSDANNYASNFALLLNPNGGNVGIGTSSPSAPLHISTSFGASNTNSYILLSNPNNGGGGRIRATNVFGDLAAIEFSDEGGGNDGNLRFFTALNASLSEGMRITSGGNVLIGRTTDNGQKLQVQGAINCLGANSGLFTQNRVSSNIFGFYASTNFILYNDDIGTIGTFAYNTGTYTPISDINKKKDFEASTIGLNAILGLKPTLYRMKDDETNGNKELGFIAQEVKEFIPQAYVENDDFIGLSDRPIIAALVKGMQEQQAQIEELKALIAAK